SFLHSVNKIDYPSAHITKKVFNKNDLDSPLDREQDMLQGLVFEKNNKTTIKQNYTPNKNLLNQASTKSINAQYIQNNKLNVTKDQGGIKYQLRSSIAKQYKDLYVEMDVELLTQDKAHYVGVNEYNHQRNK